MKKLPLGIQNLREIVEENHVYIDKTMYKHQLIISGKCHFLSRPRRFGKSLFLDTIAEVFKGGKELFKGLWIYESGYDFMSHPVIKLDMSNISNRTPEVFENALAARLIKRAKEEGIEFIDDTPSGLLNDLIEGLSKKYNQKVVVLIDEYDKPILDHVTDIKTAEANRMIIRDFYGMLKSLDSYIRFIFLPACQNSRKPLCFRV